MDDFHTADYFSKMDGGKVQCGLCPHNCIIANEKYGICGVRQNRNSTLVTTIYGCLTALAMDPIEKKPLYHFYPGSQILSIGTKGCNFKCPYCQNYHISQDLNIETSYSSPEEVTAMAVENNSIGIAYTYSEPIIWIEYVADTSRLIHEKGLQNVMVTNGFINDEPLRDLLKDIDAMNIDLKTFNDDTYKKVQKGKLGDILNTIETAYKKGCHVEITTLIVTGINDSMEEMKEIIDFIASIGTKIPWHISRYHPSFKYNKPATDINFMMDVYKEARKKLTYVYSGNISSSYDGSNTICPSCNEMVINRSGYFTKKNSLKNGKCEKCGEDLGIRD